jgi:hypothetical protein
MVTWLQNFATGYPNGPQIDFRVYLQEHFPKVGLRDLSMRLHSEFSRLGTVPHLLNDGQAIAIVWSGIATEKGPTEEVRQHSLKIAPIGRFLRQYMRDGVAINRLHDPLVLWLPQCKYAPDLWLPPGETNGRFINTGYDAPYRLEDSVRFDLSFHVEFSTRMRTQLANLAEEWFELASNAGVAGEQVRGGSFGFTFNDKCMSLQFTDYSPVTFPWVELYLRLRSGIGRQWWPRAMIYSCR